MPVLSKFERIKAIGMLEANMKPAMVAHALNVHKSTISRLRMKVMCLGEERAVKNQDRGSGPPGRDGRLLPFHNNGYNVDGNIFHFL